MSLMPSCLEASRLLSRALDEPLGLLDQALLRVHLSMCSRCTEAGRQLASLGDLTRSALDDDEPDAPSADGR
jgi:predicted anti-sigma-YlaC factor YlaD